jgi:hypothetical protein
VLCAPGRIAARGITVQSTAPIALRVTGQTLTGTAMGKGDATLTLPKGWAGRALTINGKAAGTVDDRGQVTTALPAAGARMEVK